MNNNFKNSPIHDKKAIIEMMDELEPKEMIEVVEFIKSKTKPKDMTQTAVEWLLENIAYIPMGFEIDIIKQAKEMEKQQIVKGITFFKDRPYEEITAEQYIKETYEGNKWQ